MTARLRPAALVILVVGAALTLLVVLVQPAQGDPVSLLPIAERIARGEVAYRDFPIEYPPLALLHIVLPRLIGGPSPDAYQTLFSLLGLGLAAATGGVVWWLARRDWSAESTVDSVAIYAGLALALAPMVVWRFDILPTFLAALGLALYAARRSAWAGFALGLGTGAKIFPALLVPVLGVANLLERRVRSALLLTIGFALSVGAVLAEIYLLAGSGSFSFLLYQERRGVEIESVVGGLVLLVHGITGEVASIYFGFGSYEIWSPLVDDLAVPSLFFAALLAATLVLGAWRSARRDLLDVRGVRPQTIVRYSLGVLLVVILTNKVFSPQYLVWLLPFAALMPARKSLLLLAVAGLTTLIYPLTIPALTSRDPVAVVALNLRNLGVLAYFAWLVLPDLVSRGSEGGDVGDAAQQAGDDTEDE